MLSKEHAKETLRNIIDALRDAEHGYTTNRQNGHSAKLADALTAAGNDMLKRMQLVYPILTKIQMDVVRAHGFTGDVEGLIKFSQEIAQLERDDDEIKKLNDDLREIFLPKIPSTILSYPNENGK